MLKHIRLLRLSVFVYIFSQFAIAFILWFLAYTSPHYRYGLDVNSGGEAHIEFVVHLLFLFLTALYICVGRCEFYDFLFHEDRVDPDDEFPPFDGKD